MIAFAPSIGLGLRHGGRRLACCRRLAMSTDSLPTSTAVSNAVNENPVVVFSKTWCSYSARAKGILRDELKANPVVWELDQVRIEMLLSS
jgi:glutaredoxin 3